MATAAALQQRRALPRPPDCCCPLPLRARQRRRCCPPRAARPAGSRSRPSSSQPPNIQLRCIESIQACLRMAHCHTVLIRNIQTCRDGAWLGVSSPICAVCEAGSRKGELFSCQQCNKASSAAHTHRAHCSLPACSSPALRCHPSLPLGLLRCSELSPKLS